MDKFRQGRRLALGACVAGVMGMVPRCGVPGLPYSCEPADGGTLDWVPTVLRPAFAGFADYGPDVGAPMHVRIFYPSTDDYAHCASFLSSHARFPLVLFVHGQCTEPVHYTKWAVLPETLARSGYVVAVPDLGTVVLPVALNDPTQYKLHATLDWLRSSWSRRRALTETPLGIVGHSYGALHGAVFAETVRTGAYVSLSGTWSDVGAASRLINRAAAAPKLLTWGNAGVAGALDALADPEWERVARPKFRLVFNDTEHWDYLSDQLLECRGPFGRCRLIPRLAGGISALFISKYMPPEDSGLFTETIHDNLQIPFVRLSPEQTHFAARHLDALRYMYAEPTCTASLTWLTPRERGSRLLP